MGLKNGINNLLMKAKRRLRSRMPLPSESPLEVGLQRLNNRLGLKNNDHDDQEVRAATAINVEPTDQMVRSIFYAPDMDGQADPGEVVWIWAPSDGPDRPLRERALLVVGRTRHTILGLLISPNPEHDGEEGWMDIGAGEWDASGRQCWLRIDRIVEVSELGIRRQGAIFPRRRFDRVANKLRNRYAWG
ncbi:type II toxin-antitoxin system PemK/MazF family toxin [Corynebacterium halotolerans]|uniref:type II toxin-antitoxin system PemK/MazF family toxin n=1 Tax=Corynebacterium halotolerans TaxID=225326 RepID=UPI003CE701BF